MVGLHVRSASGEHHAVETLEQIVQTELFRQGGDEQRQTTGSIEHGAGVLVTHDMKRVLTEHTAVGWNTD